MPKFIHLTLLASGLPVSTNLEHVICVHPSTSGKDDTVRGTILRLIDGNHVEVIESHEVVKTLLPE